MKAMGYSSKVVTDATLDSTTGNITVSKIENGTSGSSTLDLASIYAKKTDLLEYRIDGYGTLTLEQVTTLASTTGEINDSNIAVALRTTYNSMEFGKLYVLITEELANSTDASSNAASKDMFLSLWRKSKQSGLTFCIEKVMSGDPTTTELSASASYNMKKKLVRDEIHVTRFSSIIYHNRFYIFNDSAFQFDSSTNTLNIDLDID